MDDHTFLYLRICSDTLSMTTPAMDQSMQKCSITVQRVVRQKTNSSAVMMAVVVALVANEVGWRRVEEGVGFRPEQRMGLVPSVRWSDHFVGVALYIQPHPEILQARCQGQHYWRAQRHRQHEIEPFSRMVSDQLRRYTSGDTGLPLHVQVLH